MPLPNYGYFNKEDRKSQELVFEMAPEMVDDDGDGGGKFATNKHRKRAQLTTGKLGIDLERKMVIHADKDKDLWRSKVDPNDLAEARRYASPDRQIFRREVKSSIDSLISADKLKQIKNTRRPTTSDYTGPSDYNIDDRAVRFSVPPSSSHTPSYSSSSSSNLHQAASRRFSAPSQGSSYVPTKVAPVVVPRETTRSGVSIQPGGTFKIQQVSSSYQMSASSSSRVRNPRGLY